MDRPIFLNVNEDHPVQNRESLENSSEEIVQKQNMEKTMLDLVKICHHKQFLCIHDDVDDLIESALDSKLLSINSISSQHIDKKEQEVKIVEEQPAECRNLAPILSTKEPENSLSMGYEHLSITPETESDEVTESNAKNLLPIPSECEVTLEDKRECDELICENSSTINVCDNHSKILFDSNNDDLLSDDESFEDIEYVDASVPDPAIIPPGIEYVADDPDGDIRFLEELHINDSILSHESFDSNFEKNTSISRPPPEPPDDELDLESDSGKYISAVVNKDASGDENDDYFPFMFVIRFLLPYFIFPDISLLLLSAESEDTIFDPGISD
nr:hypothetical protein [Tanacetum cinerariifolium]